MPSSTLLLARAVRHAPSRSAGAESLRRIAKRLLTGARGSDAPVSIFYEIALFPLNPNGINQAVNTGEYKPAWVLRDRLEFAGTGIVMDCGMKAARSDE